MMSLSRARHPLTLLMDATISIRRNPRPRGRTRVMSRAMNALTFFLGKLRYYEALSKWRGRATL